WAAGGCARRARGGARLARRAELVRRDDGVMAQGLQAPPPPGAAAPADLRGCSLARGRRAVVCEPQCHLDGVEEGAKGVAGIAEGSVRSTVCALIPLRSACFPRLSSNLSPG